jgi:opacity protein-like surface antigen
MNRSMQTVLALAASALFATAAQAQQGPSGIVVGAAGGFSKFNDSCEGVSQCDTTDRGTRFNVGYGLGSGLVVEAVSFNFGKLKGADSGVSVEIGATAFGGGVAYYLPSGNDGSLFVRLGLAQVKAKVKGSGFGITITDNDSQTTFYAGLGYAWKLSQNAALELAWETTQLKYQDTKEAVSAATLGVSFRF